MRRTDKIIEVFKGLTSHTM